jgi:hypothetical protein
MTGQLPLRGSAIPPGRLSSASVALSRVRELGLQRALDPKNVAKGPWDGLEWQTLVDLLRAEVDELVEALESGDLPSVEHEAGDVVWCVAMLVDRVRGK